MNTSSIISALEVRAVVDRVIAAQPVLDMHTHLYPPAFGTPVQNATGQVDPKGLMLWGVDELVTYHYLVAEVFRVVPATKLPYEQFWKMSKRQQADHIWRELFVERTPISEACRGILTTLTKLGFDPNEKSLDAYRPFFLAQDPDRFIDKVMEISNVSSITMTNPVFDDNERERWDKEITGDSRFKAVLRIDPLLRNWPEAARKLSQWGYRVSEEISSSVIAEVQRFLRDWIKRQRPIYLAVSLPPEFRHPVPETSAVLRQGQTVLEKAVLPVCAENGLPFAMMIGSRPRVNPALADAGDMTGKADIQAVTSLCEQFPASKFFVTMLARENQHELCVAARKFGNLMPFGCWWFLNNPSLITEIETMRIELLGTSFIPQHSDARVLDQLIYKWDHSRRIIAEVLGSKYAELMQTGRRITEVEIARDVRLLFEGNFTEFLGR